MSLKSLVSYLFSQQAGQDMSVKPAQVADPPDVAIVAAAAAAIPKDKGLRKNGKNWHDIKKPFRPNKGLTSYQKRIELEKAAKATRSREQEMKDEKDEERSRRVQAIIDRRKAKEEKERYEKMAEKMHAKRVERRKKREKRNKLLKS